MTVPPDHTTQKVLDVYDMHIKPRFTSMADVDKDLRRQANTTDDSQHIFLVTSC